MRTNETKKRIDLATLKPVDPDPNTVYEIINGVRCRVGIKLSNIQQSK